MQRSSWTDNAIWIILFILLIPSGLAVASWGSLPGQRLYNVKIGMENALVALAPTNQAKGELQVAYSQQRFSEATQLLNNAADPAGLENFRQQVEAAKLAISQAPPGPARDNLVARYLASLQEASTSLEQQRQIIGGQSSSSTPGQSVTVNRVVVVQQIVQTQTVIQNVINTVQVYNTTQVSAPVTETPTPMPAISTDTPTPSPEQSNETGSPINTSTPIQTVTPTSTDMPTPTPTSWDHGNGGDHGNGNGNN